jgi:hypothetical protein
MSYEDAPQTKMLATHCCVCGRPLVDAKSVELGIGPECGQFLHGVSDITEGQRELGNQLVHAASVYTSQGRLDKVRECATAIGAIGLVGLAEILEDRCNDAVAKAKIEIGEADGRLWVSTPFKRSRKEEFTKAWRAIPGRRWDAAHECNVVPADQRPAVLALLKEFFPGEYAVGPKGPFMVVP